MSNWELHITASQMVYLYLCSVMVCQTPKLQIIAIISVSNLFSIIMESFLAGLDLLIYLFFSEYKCLLLMETVSCHYSTNANCKLMVEQLRSSARSLLPLEDCN